MLLGRFRSSADLLFEWAVAAAFLLATCLVTFLLARELRRNLHAPVPAAPPIAMARPAVLPARAVGVPTLLLLDGRTVRVGDTAARVVGLLGREMRSDSLGRGPLGDRVANYYERAGTRFILVFEPFEAGGQPRVAAIYLN